MNIKSMNKLSQCDKHKRRVKHMQTNTNKHYNSSFFIYSRVCLKEA